jgi:hypothetical protein
LPCGVFDNHDLGFFAIATKNQLWQNRDVQVETVVVTKRNVLKSQLPLSIVAATVVLLTVMWLVYRIFVHSKCDSIFEQTADKMQVNVEFIKIKGKLALGQEKVQELTEAAQKVGVHLKTCCIAQQAGILNADQFQVCMSGAKDYQNQIIQVVTNIKEANAAEEQQKPELARQKTDAAKEGASKIVNTEKALARTTEALPAPAKDIPGSKDHPLLKRFEGSEIVRYKTANYDTLDFYGKDKAKVTMEGQMVRVLFRIPAGKTTTALEVFRNYENELKKKGWELVLSGPVTEFISWVATLIGQHGLDPKLAWNQARNPYYIYAVKHDPAGDVHLDVIVTEINHDEETFKTDDVAVSVDSIQVKPVANKME